MFYVSNNNNSISFISKITYLKNVTKSIMYLYLIIYNLRTFLAKVFAAMMQLVGLMIIIFIITVLDSKNTWNKKYNGYGPMFPTGYAKSLDTLKGLTLVEMSKFTPSDSEPFKKWESALQFSEMIKHLYLIRSAVLLKPGFKGPDDDDSYENEEEKKKDKDNAWSDYEEDSEIED